MSSRRRGINNNKINLQDVWCKAGTGFVLLRMPPNQRINLTWLRTSLNSVATNSHWRRPPSSHGTVSALQIFAVLSNADVNADFTYRRWYWNKWLRRDSGMILTRGNRSTLIKTSASVTPSLINLIGIVLVSKPTLRHYKPATKRPRTTVHVL